MSNTPGAVVDSTADVGMFLLLGAIRNFGHGLIELRRGIEVPVEDVNGRELEK